jgi:hypothetical protein
LFINAYCLILLPIGDQGRQGIFVFL